MYRIALIGYGRWGRVLLPHLQDRFDVAWIFGRSLKKEGIFTNSLDDVFDKSVDAVVVATPIGAHSDIVRMALKKGKHVFCEKPLSVNPERARELIQLAKENGVHLVTDYTYTFSRRLNGAKEYLDRYGYKINLLEFNLIRKTPSAGRDIRWLLMSHALSVLDMFTDIRGLHFKPLFESDPYFIMLYSGKSQGKLTTAMSSDINRTSLEIHADKVELKMDELQLDDNIGCALDYFSGVMDGAIDNSQNLDRSYKVTEILSKMGK